jgi:hypothetical protein
VISLSWELRPRRVKLRPDEAAAEEAAVMPGTML